jgi:hypothetical protein
MGFDPKFSLGSVSTARVQQGISRACRLEPRSYANICNVKFAGSTGPMILFRSASYANYWCLTYPGKRAGTGTVIYSNHPQVVAAYTDEILFSLAFHELWHCLGTRPLNRREDVGYPAPGWADDSLRKQYGAPTAAAAEDDDILTVTSQRGKLARLADRIQAAHVTPFPPRLSWWISGA